MSQPAPTDEQLAEASETVYAAGCVACDDRPPADLLRLAETFDAERVECMVCDATYGVDALP